MCGFVGFYGIKSPQLIRAMSEKIAHRGPDDSGFCQDGLLSFGHRRLSIIDLKGGRQPLTNENKTIWLVFNGEIYNFSEIRARLVKKRHKFKTKTDSEVVIHLYEEKGEGLFEDLNGMFAFALWDKKKQKLLLGRDRFGEKPLYYAFFKKEKILLFASEIKALLCYPKFTPKINQRALGEFLIFTWFTGRETLIKGIYRLPPASYLLFEEGKIKIRRYWRIPQRRQRSWQWEEAEDMLLDKLTQAVRRQLISDVPVGVSLSGGIDSSSVLAVAAKYYPGKLKTFTVGFSLPTDEFTQARIAARYYQTDHHEAIIKFAEMTKFLPKMIWHLEEPISNSTIARAYFLAKFARRYCKVILKGDGSDEIFGGYINFKLFSPWFKFLPDGLKKRLFLYPGHFGLTPSQIKRYSPTTFPYVEKIIQEDYLSYFRNKNDLFWNARRFEIEKELVNNQLMRIDKSSMAWGVEARSPFLDHQFVELAFQFPSSLIMRGLKEKYILRRALAKMLPAQITKRRKINQDFLSVWLDDSLRPYAWDILTSSRAKINQLVDKNFIEKIFDLESSQNPLTRITYRGYLFAFLTLELWLREFFKNEPE